MPLECELGRVVITATAGVVVSKKDGLNGGVVVAAFRDVERNEDKDGDADGEADSFKTTRSARTILCGSGHGRR